MSTALPVVLIHGNDRERAALRAAFEGLPNVQIAGERGDLRAGIAMAHQSRPAILVLELSAPPDDVLTAAAQYKLDHPDVAIFFSTDLLDPETLLRAMRAGASEVLRNQSPSSSQRSPIAWNSPALPSRRTSPVISAASCRNRLSM